GEVVDVCVVALLAEGFEPAVQFEDSRRRTHFAHLVTRIDVLVVVADRQHGGEHRLDFVRFSKVGDHGQVVLDGRYRSPAGDVVRAGQHKHSGRVKVDDVSFHAAQHLAGDLAADSPIHELAAGEVLVQPPAIGNGIAQENDAFLVGGKLGQFRVGVSVAA